MVRNYSVYMPVVPGSIEQEWEQCLNQINGSLSEGNLPLKLNIFVSQPDYISYVKVKKQISRSVLENFAGHCPAFNVTIHPPEKPWKVGVEAMFISEESVEITTEFWQSVPYVILRSGSYKEVWSAGLGNDLYPNDTRKAAIEAFESVAGILSREKMTFNNVVRQWNYIGNILEINKGFQNYQLFNEVRSEFYNKYRTIHNYPAATGIGMKYGGVFIDFCAVISDDVLRIKAVDNPNQVNAYEYDQHVLKGLTGKGKTVKNPPQFERALLMVNNKSRYLFISGTASIIGQETIGKGDVKEQTLVTIENIHKLTDSERIAGLLGSQDITTGKYELLRVYIKNQEDFPEVMKICKDHFPEVPSIFIESDICREDLLTEIEAEFQI